MPRLRLPRTITSRLDSGPSALPRVLPAPETGEKPLYPYGDPRRPPEWSVPIGVRTASEWSWRLVVIAVAIALVVFGLATISEVVIPVIVATLLAALLQPIFQRLSRVMSHGAAAGVTLVGTLAIIAGILTVVGTQFVDQFGNISAQVGQGYEQIRTWLRTTMHVSDSQLTAWLDKAKESVSQGTGSLGQTAAQAGITVGHTIAGFFIAMFTLFFFLYHGEQIWGWVVRLFPRGVRAKVHSSGLIAWGQLSAYTRATVIVAAVDAAGIGIVAAILGVPFASGVAVLVFFGAFIPIIGALISGAVPVLLALVALGPVKALIMLGGVILVQQVESHVLQPFLLGRAVRVHPLAVILGLATGAVLAGIVGALIAVPTVAVLNAVGHHLLDPDPAHIEAAEDMLTEAERQEVRSAVHEQEQIAHEQMKGQAVDGVEVRQDSEPGQDRSETP